MQTLRWPASLLKNLLPCRRAAIIADACWSIQVQVLLRLQAADTTDGHQFSKVECLC